MKGILAVLAALGCATLATPAHAGGFGIPEIGVRRTGMAAVVGRPDEPAAVFHNPAGLTLLPGVRVYASFGLALLNTEFKLRPWQDSDRWITAPVDANGYYPTTRPTRAVGAIPMLVASAEILPRKLWGAVAAYVSNGTGAQFAPTDVTRYHLIDGYIVAPTFTAVAAYQVRPELAVGVGAGYMNVRVHGKRYLFPIVNGLDASRLIGSNGELTIDGEDWDFTWNAGVLVKPVRGLSIGATVLGRVDPTLAGEVRLVTGDDATVPHDQYVGSQKTGLVLPWTLLGGINYDVDRRPEVGAEVRYYRYRAYTEQRTNVSGLPLISSLVTPKNYEDSWQLAGGVRVHDLPGWPCGELMIGGHYDKTPAPPQTVTFDQPTFSHWGLHTGVRFPVGRFKLGASYLHYWYRIPIIKDSITNPPSNIRGEGGNHIITVSLEAALRGSIL